MTPTAAELDPSGDALPLRATRSVNPQDVTVDAALLAANGQIVPPQIAASQSVLPKPNRFDCLVKSGSTSPGNGTYCLAPDARMPLA